MAMAMKPILIPRICGLDNHTFQEQYRNKKPVIVSDIISGWIPIDKWTPGYLKYVLQQTYDDTLKVFISKDNKHFINHPDVTDMVTMTSEEFMNHVFNSNDHEAESDKKRYYLRTKSMPEILLRDIDAIAQVDSLLDVIYIAPTAVNSDDAVALETTCVKATTTVDDLECSDFLHKDINMNKVIVTENKSTPLPSEDFLSPSGLVEDGTREESSWEDFMSPLSLEEDDPSDGTNKKRAKGIENAVSSSIPDNSQVEAHSRRQDAQSRIFNESTMQLWIGTRGNITPLHYDRNHGLLAQMVGRKELILFSHEDTSFIYPYPSHSDRAHTSRVNLRRMGDVDYAKRFPKWEEAQPYTCILQPGDLLYTPPFWWHDVTSLDECVSVTLPWDIDGYEEFPLSMLR